MRRARGEGRRDVGERLSLDRGDRAPVQVEADHPPQHRVFGHVDRARHFVEDGRERGVLLRRHEHGAEPASGSGDVRDDERALGDEELAAGLDSHAQVGIGEVDVRHDPGIVRIADADRIGHRCPW